MEIKQENIKRYILLKAFYMASIHIHNCIQFTLNFIGSLQLWAITKYISFSGTITNTFSTESGEYIKRRVHYIHWEIFPNRKMFYSVCSK